MKKKKNNIVSEEIISEEEIYEDDGELTEYPETTTSKINKSKILTIGIIVVLLAIAGVLAFFVAKKYSNKAQPDIQQEIEQEPESPYISVSTTPSPTVVPTEVPTATPTPEIEEELTEEISDNEYESLYEDLFDDEEDSLDLEEEFSASLDLEEADDEEEIDEKYKDYTVYYVNDLMTFHTKDCSIINDKNKIKTTAYSALSNGFEECKTCKPLGNATIDSLSEEELKALDAITVYKTASNTKYHTKECSILKDTGIEITLKEAIENNLEACSLCKPKTLENYKDSDTTKKESTTTTVTPTSSAKTTITPTPTKTSGTTSKVTPTPAKTITPTPVAITSLSITGGTVKVGGTLQLYISYAPTNAVSTLTYTVSNAKIATISSAGVITGISPGTITVTLSAPNGVYATSTVVVVSDSSTGSTTPTPTPGVTSSPSYTDTNLDINNLGLVGVSKFVYPSNINLIDMEAMSDWQSFIYKIDANGGSIVTTSSTVTLNAGGVTRLQLTKSNDNIWTIRIYDGLNNILNKCALKAICTKISSMPDSLYSQLYKDYEESEFIGERYRVIGDAYVRAEVSGGSTTYYIKDKNYENSEY